MSNGQTTSIVCPSAAPTQEASHGNHHSCLLYPTISTFSFPHFKCSAWNTSNKWYEIPHVLIISAIRRRYVNRRLTWIQTFLYDPLILNIASSRILWVNRITSVLTSSLVIRCFMSQIQDLLISYFLYTKPIEVLGDITHGWSNSKRTYDGMMGRIRWSRYSNL
jgi:hypothetical protein